MENFNPIKYGSILQFDDKVNPILSTETTKAKKKYVVTGGMLISKNISFSIVENFGRDFFQSSNSKMYSASKENLQSIGKQCKKIFDSTNANKLNNQQFTFEIENIKYQMFSVSCDRIVAISPKRKKSILIENIPSGYVFFQCEAPNQIGDLVESVNDWIVSQKQ